MKRKAKNNFPLEHLSASSITLLENDEKKWIEKYVYGKPIFTTEYMKFGRKLADFYDDDIKIECILKRKGESMKVIGYLDGYNARTATQYENKSSTTPWTQKQANNALQLKIYALIHHKNNGTIPKQELTWRRTKMVDGELELTGEQGTFQVKQTMVDLLMTESRVWKAYDRIIKIMETQYEKI
jgi:hypothetical protein